MTDGGSTSSISFFSARYLLTGPTTEAPERAQAIAVEQTIEFPAQLVTDESIRSGVIGKVESVEVLAEEQSVATIRYPIDTTGFELPQLLNVLYGNCSLLSGVRVIGLTLPPQLLERFRGPRFGLPGMRTRLGVRGRPLLATALKPMGLDSRALAAMAATLARAGIDLIKDDHGLANQRFATFTDRVRACAEAVRDANESAGTHTLYLPSINAPSDELESRVRYAAEAGAGGLLMMPGLTGFDSMRSFADDESLGLPIMSHPAFLGAFVASAEIGIEHGTLFGTIMRLAGADMTVFPSYGGRFTFSTEECAAIARASRQPLGEVKPILPVPAGGMTLDRIGELAGFYGPDTVLLVGGNLHHGDLYENVRRMIAAVEEAAGG